MDLYCAEKAKIAMLGGSYYIGWVLGAFVFLKAADIHGRVKIMRASMVLFFALYSAIIVF